MIEQYHKSIRIKDYDYSQNGAYFITICSSEKKFLFGNIVGTDYNLSNIGTIVQRCWYKIPEHFENVILDSFVIMPNHVHGIINIVGTDYNQSNVKVDYNQPLRNKFQHVIPRSLSYIIAGFKSAVTRNVGADYNQPLRIWQRNYYEHIIRNENEANKIREYIKYNPLKWELDYENPKREKEYKSFTEYMVINVGTDYNQSLQKRGESK